MCEDLSMSNFFKNYCEKAGNRCGYCLGEQRYIFAPLEIDHLLPTAKGGTDNEENLWLACRLCNSYKGTQTHGTDNLTKKKTPPFNPRQQNWKTHFKIVGGIKIVGKTAVGRATITALRECNAHKAAKTKAIDRLTGKVVKLFNPQTQNWREHFEFSEDFSEIVGKTACGRATVEERATVEVNV